MDKLTYDFPTYSTLNLINIKQYESIFNYSVINALEFNEI